MENLDKKNTKKFQGLEFMKANFLAVMATDKVHLFMLLTECVKMDSFKIIRFKDMLGWLNKVEIVMLASM